MQRQWTGTGNERIGFSLYQSIGYVVEGIAVESDVVVIERKAITFIAYSSLTPFDIRIIQIFNFLHQIIYCGLVENVVFFRLHDRLDDVSLLYFFALLVIGI